MISRPDKNQKRLRRHKRVRGKISGTASVPRLCVYRSLNNISAQIIDDDAGKTLVAAASNEKDFAANGANKDGAKEVGLLIGKRAIAKGIENVVFDRGGYLYHGRVQQLAEGAREAGLKF
ncbi:MAG: 50S ribosomal protein L18 [Clostridia bacterium]|nr:50S ribosomal protein L18 [Clostridia bacterium]